MLVQQIQNNPVYTNTACTIQWVQQNADLSQSQLNGCSQWLEQVCNGLILPDQLLASKYGYRDYYSYYSLIVESEKFSQSSNTEIRFLISDIIRNACWILSESNCEILYFHHCDRLICFIPIRSEKKSNCISSNVQQFSFALEQIFKSVKYHICIGSLVKGVELFRESYECAIKTLSLTAGIAPNETVSFYTDWQMYILLVGSSRQELTQYVKFQLSPLLQEQELFETLKVYLDNNENPKVTSELLNFHPNTIKYRISKIEDILHIDLKDSMVRFRLRMALLIAEYLQI